jgi:transcriptional regulator with XRE-family HTH domain
MKGENFMNQEKIGKFIAEKRKEKKLTQAELAERLGVSDRSISNWENGKNMPDLSLFKPLCDELDISLNNFLSGEVVKEKEYFTKFEENIINTIDYSNKKIENKNNLIGLILIIFGVLILITAIAIFPSESSWGSIYSMFGVIISLLGFNKFIRHLTFLKRLLCNLGYFLTCMTMLLLIDYIGVVNIHEAPRFSITKTYYNNIMYYDTLFYDVVRCNVDEDNETYKVIKNQKHDLSAIESLCK